jgi:hypothetical protein
MREIFEILRAVDYRGLLALEIDYLHPETGSEDASISESLAYMRSLLEATSRPQKERAASELPRRDLPAAKVHWSPVHVEGEEDGVTCS